MACDKEEKSLDSTSKGSETSKNSASWEKTNHPLFLHHSDQLGAVLVSQPLMEDNYINWVQSMTMELTIKNQKGFIDGTLTKPTHNLDEQRQWERYNTLVKTWLLGTMSKEISSSVIHCRDARGMWLELKECFSHRNTVSLFQIENAFHECEQGTTSVMSFSTKLKALWDEKNALCGFTRNCEAASEVKAYIETQKTMKFFMGLNESYAQTRSNIIGMDPLPSLNKAYAAVLRHEKQIVVSQVKPTASSEASAFSVKRHARDFQPKEGEAKFCEKCNMTNHNTKNCRSHLKCTYCNGKGHTLEYCRRRKKIMVEGQSSSRANHVGLLNESKEDVPTFPLSQSECQQVMGLLSKLKIAATKTNDGQ
ncbi:uncharacterized protein LOC112177417 [Rosa chinensis]|uniref:uncharacterized protein LOC112177417 n=1 Tax=Rosa chinensis TaxID=74649 RepID=UPI000D088732|nr:uncharacterized protein LOC112177417 [Rosa chinensis]